MKKDKTIYWITTGIIVLIMLFSMYKMYTPDYDRMHLPNYLRIELTVFKIIGLLVLLLPQFPNTIKEWAYAGFGITLVSAMVAHMQGVEMPLMRVTGAHCFSRHFIHFQFLYEKTKRQSIMKKQKLIHLMLWGILWILPSKNLFTPKRLKNLKQLWKQKNQTPNKYLSTGLLCRKKLSRNFSKE